MADQQLDDMSQFEAKETSHTLPVGWLLLFWGLVLWGVWYLWAYTPGLGGWSQEAEFQQVGEAASGATIFATVLFTALATTAAVSIIFALSRARKR
jgi:hypothetical protein